MRDQPGQVTFAAQPGDAVVMDYRLLHGTHANGTDRRRDCVILNFAPAWSRLPAEIRGHLIQHPALPGPDEAVDPGLAGLLPRYDGPRRDLVLTRHPPAGFAIAG